MKVGDVYIWNGVGMFDKKCVIKIKFINDFGVTYEYIYSDLYGSRNINTFKDNARPITKLESYLHGIESEQD